MKATGLAAERSAIASNAKEADRTGEAHDECE
jgi:hypothetical protein